jgi:hypothetical protein
MIDNSIDELDPEMVEYAKNLAQYADTPEKEEDAYKALEAALEGEAYEEYIDRTQGMFTNDKPDLGTPSEQEELIQQIEDEPGIPGSISSKIFAAFEAKDPSVSKGTRKARSYDRIKHLTDRIAAKKIELAELPDPEDPEAMEGKDEREVENLQKQHDDLNVEIEMLQGELDVLQREDFPLSKKINAIKDEEKKLRFNRELKVIQHKMKNEPGYQNSPRQKMALKGLQRKVNREF